MRYMKGTRGRILRILALVSIGVTLGSIYVYKMNSWRATNVLELDFENGGLILLPADRIKIKEQAVNKAMENDKVKALLVGKSYTVQATLIINSTIQEITQNNTLTRSSTRITVRGYLVVVVTITFEDGSGYNIQIDLRDWTVGEPEFAEKVYPPDPTHRIGPADPTRRITP